MVLQDVSDHAAAIAEASRVLGAGGAFCIAIVHPVASAGKLDDDEVMTLGSYCTAFEQSLPLHEHTVTHYHRSLSGYARALEEHAFTIEALREIPTKRKAPGRYPMFLHLRARRR